MLYSKIISVAVDIDAEAPTSVRTSKYLDVSADMTDSGSGIETSIDRCDCFLCIAIMSVLERSHKGDLSSSIINGMNDGGLVL